MAPDGQLLADAETISRSIKRMALAIVDDALRSGALSASNLAIVGIRRGGVPIAKQLAALIEEAEGGKVPLGTIDIALYRDDAATALPDPKIGPSTIDFDVSGRDVVLVDDVLQTGRTVRAGIDALLDYGRPRRIWLAVLFDRGGRELPIAPDFVGRELEIESTARVEVEVDDAGNIQAARARPRGAR